MMMPYKVMILLLAAFLLGGALKLAADWHQQRPFQTTAQSVSPDRGSKY